MRRRSAVAPLVAFLSTVVLTLALAACGGDSGGGGDTTKTATDAFYIAEQQPQGLLKWWLAIPASARGLNSMTIDYTVRIDRAKDVQMTPLPE